MFFNMKKILSVFAGKSDEIRKEVRSLKTDLLELRKVFWEIKKINHASLLTNIINLADIDKKDKEILALLMQNKFDNVVINNNDICFENINKYLQLVKPVDIDVKYLKRVGGNKDGGYVMFTPPPSFFLCY
ncbi:hypothetical protein CINS5906_05755 [Campylobacter insulaenigrae]|uniref:hypothetical protein n=1 Tax=Campylobacter insulaenigrae TaxID=260714 RepID=UPI0021538F79|nr:hypothetical protein [Campylobacter insulaenigrae]MCR6585069.1 hypothetical protein [Campylobacter insulaenigrae]